MARKTEELKKCIANLKEINSHIIDELLDADQILRQVGFKDGLKTVKEAAREIIILRSKN